jgi:hypothetical protein
MAEIKEDVERDKAKMKDDFQAAGSRWNGKIPYNLQQRALKKIERCLDVKRNRLPEPLNSLCNPNSIGWQKDENILISKLLAVYRAFTPLKASRRIYENMAMIFIACGLRTDMTMNDCDKLSETLRKRRIKAAPSV